MQYTEIILISLNVDYKDNDVKNARIGEMKFIRALYYFNLVRIFGDVPLVTDEVTNPQDYFGQERTAVSEVYDQILSDLSDAISLLPNRTNTSKTRAYKTSAQALKGKVELTLGKYSEAKNTLLEVVNSGSHSLLDNPDDVFSLSNELNEEIIFSVQFASGINGNSEGTDAFRLFNPTARASGAKGHGVLPPSFYDLYDDNDSRKDVYVGLLDSGVAYSNKVKEPKTVIKDSGSDWVVLRYADVILMLAEIELKLGNNSQAIDYLNQIRQRANLDDYSGNSDDNSIFDAIDLERRKELVWEGHRWFDLLRQGRATSVLNISDSDKLLMPIPASQIATDPAITQNPGY